MPSSIRPGVWEPFVLIVNICFKSTQQRMWKWNAYCRSIKRNLTWRHWLVFFFFKKTSKNELVLWKRGILSSMVNRSRNCQQSTLKFHDHRTQMIPSQTFWPSMECTSVLFVHCITHSHRAWWLGIAALFAAGVSWWHMCWVHWLGTVKRPAGLLAVTLSMPHR